MAIGMVAGLHNDFELTLSTNFVTMGKGDTARVYVNSPSNGPIYAFSSNPNIIYANAVNRQVNIKSLHYGSAIISVGQDVGIDYTDTGDYAYANKTPASKNIFVVATTTGITTYVGSTSWNLISEISKEGNGNQFWAIGDVKGIRLNGTIGTVTFNNFNCDVFILHFNYPMNGIPENNIIWGGFKDDDGKYIALVDSNYDNESSDGTMYFNMNHWGNNNNGGWKGCDFRYDILGATSTQPSNYGTSHTTACIGYDATTATLANPKANTLLAALDAGFRKTLRLWSRWIDAKGNNSNVDANIEETVDAVTLLTEFEIFGSRGYANQYEQKHQSQMEYFRTSNPRYKYKHDYKDSNYSENNSAWHLASPGVVTSIGGNKFCCVWKLDQCGWCSAAESNTIAPAFKT